MTHSPVVAIVGTIEGPVTCEQKSFETTGYEKWRFWSYPMDPSNVLCDKMTCARSIHKLFKVVEIGNQAYDALTTSAARDTVLEFSLRLLLATLWAAFFAHRIKFILNMDKGPFKQRIFEM